MTEENKTFIKATRGFNFIAVIGLELQENSQEMSMDFGVWFNDTPKQFKINVLTNVAKMILEKTEELENENV